MSKVVDRHRLLTMIEQTPCLWLVEACAGSGKSLLARQVARVNGTEVSRKLPVADHVGMSAIVTDLTGTTWSPAPDEIAFLKARPDDALTVVLARQMSPEAIRCGSDLGARWLRATDLWFDDAEMTDLAEQTLGQVTAARVGRSLGTLTDGWPPALRAFLDEAARWPDQSCDTGADATRAFSSAMKTSTATLSARELSDIASVAVFDRIDEPMAEALGCPQIIDRMTEAGLPLLTDGRWYWLGTVARSHLRSQATSRTTPDDSVFAHLVDEGRVVEAIEAATEFGRDELAAELFAAQGVDAAFAMDAARSGAVLARLGAALAMKPRAQLVRARQQLAGGDLTASIESLRAGVGQAEAARASSDVLAELQTELAYGLYMSGDLEGARATLPTAEPPDLATRARWHQVTGGLDALTMEPDALDRAARSYRASERDWSAAGEVAMAGAVLTSLAMEVTSRTGHLNDAIALVERALLTAAVSPLRRSATQLIRVRLLALAGRHDEAEILLREVDGLVGIVMRGWMAAHTHQARAIIASHRGDAEVVAAQLDLAQKELGDLSAHAAGAALHADAIDAFARCGDASSVSVHLDALRAHEHAEPPDVALSEVIAACRIGDARMGLELADTFRNGELSVPGGAWKLELMASIAESRLGRAGEAEEAMVRARELARTVGTPDIIDLTEQAIDLTKPEHPTPVGETSQTARVRIELLNDFSVLVSGAPVDLPRGRGRTLLKLLALRSGRVSIDEALDTLWPDGDPVVSRRRLRNVLSRLRALCGEVVLRDGDILQLADDAESDFAEWWGASLAALTGRTGERAQLVDLAAAAPDVLLATDQYEEWLQPLQQRYRHQLLRVLDGIVNSACPDPDGTDVWATLRAVELDPWSVERLDAAATLLRTAHRYEEIARLEERKAQLV